MISITNLTTNQIHASRALQMAARVSTIGIPDAWYHDVFCYSSYADAPTRRQPCAAKRITAIFSKGLPPSSQKDYRHLLKGLPPSSQKDYRHLLKRITAIFSKGLPPSSQKFAILSYPNQLNPIHTSTCMSHKILFNIMAPLTFRFR